MDYLTVPSNAPIIYPQVYILAIVRPYGSYYFNRSVTIWYELIFPIIK